MWKIIRHPLFLYVLFIYLIFAFVSNVASAQTVYPTCTGGSNTGSGGGCFSQNDLDSYQAQCQAPNVFSFYTEEGTCRPSSLMRGSFICHVGAQCTCPSGYQFSGNSCVAENPPICVPPEVDLGNGECGLPQCGEGYITQGHINGQPICQLDCTPYGGGAPGWFNGVEGCYGGDGPSCPEGTYWGQVNGVSGCWGDGSGSGSSSSTGGGDGGSGSSGGTGS